MSSPFSSVADAIEAAFQDALSRPEATATDTRARVLVAGRLTAREQLRVREGEALRLRDDLARPPLAGSRASSPAPLRADSFF